MKLKQIALIILILLLSDLADAQKKTLPPVVTPASSPLTVKILNPTNHSSLHTTDKEKTNLIPPEIIPLAVLKNEKKKVVKGKDGKPFILGEGGIADFKNYTAENGLALDGIYYSFKDHFGNLWFTSAGGGVSRFDGKSFTNYTTADGLVNNSVRSGTEDENGNIWLGTNGGVSRFDGTTFTNYTATQGLINNRVRSIIQDKKGNIWFGTEGGISRFDGKTFKNYTTSEGLADNIVRCILEDKAGNIWFGTNNGLSHYDGKELKNYYNNHLFSNKEISCLLEDNMGNLWFGSYGDGVIKYDGKDYICYTITDGLADNKVRSLYEDRNNTIWLGTDGGLSCFNSSNQKTKEDRLFTNYTTLQGLPSNEITSILEDNSGHLWLSTIGGGISLYNGKSFTNFNTSSGLANNLVRSILEDKNGELWFGTDGNGVSRYNGKTFTNYNTLQGLCNNTVWSILEDKAGNIWLGTNGGVSCYNGKSFANFTKMHGLANNFIRSIYEDKMGNIWFGTQEGASCYNGKSFTNYTTDQGLSNNIVSCIIQDKTGNIWLGTYGGGACRFDGKTFVNYTTEQGLANNIIFSMHEDNSGNIWFGTYGGGISRFDGTSFINFHKLHGLPDDVVTQIVVAPYPAFDVQYPQSVKAYKEEQYLTLGTNMGLAVLTGWKDKNDKLLSANFCSKKGDINLAESSNEILKNYSPIFKVYNSTTGYPVKDVNSGQNGMYTDSKGAIWIATGSNKTALVHFKPMSLNKVIHPPIVFIQNIKINEETVSWHSLQKNKNTFTTTMESNGTPSNIVIDKFSDIQFDSITSFYPVPQHLVLPFNKNNITFEFAAIEPAKPYLIQYQYILEGYSNEWSPLTNKTNAVFGNIHEGNYTFKLRALSPEGIWSQPVIYTFQVLPPWYRSWWAFGSYIILFSSLFSLLFRWRTQALRRDKELLEETVKERTFEIVKQKNLVEEKNTLITDSIEYAQNIQQAILPSEEDMSVFFKNHFILYKPKDIISGDFYWLHESDEKVIIAVADCTGHGVPGAFMSLMGHNLLTEIVKTQMQFTPATILDELNTQIISTLKQTSTKMSAKYGMDIAIISINKNFQTLEYAGAHIPLLIFRNKECILLKANKRSIGFLKTDKEFSFTNHTVVLDKNDVLYLFSDGYADQLGGQENKKFFSQTLRQLLQSICELDMGAQKEILSNTHSEWQGQKKQTDDILIVGIKID